MRIACPSCTAAYEVPESRLSRHKLVRCVRCRAEWIPVHRAADVAPPPQPVEQFPSPPAADVWPSMTAMDRLAASPQPRGLPAALLGAWVLTFVVLVAGLAATVTWREAIMQVWPPSALILAPFGHTAPAAAQTSPKPAPTAANKPE